MSIKCKTPEELAKAVKNKEESIEIEGKLGETVIRIKATGKIAWGVCAIALAAAIVFYIATPVAVATTTPAGGAAAFMAGAVATTTVAATLGSTAAIAAVTIGVAAGGISALETLRDKYKIVEKDKNRIILKRK